MAKSKLPNALVEQTLEHATKYKKIQLNVSRNQKERTNTTDDTYLKEYFKHQLKLPTNTDKKDFRAAPTANKNVLLAVAFTLAEKLYSELRSKVHEKGKAMQSAVITDENVDISEDGVQILSPIECLTINCHLLKGKNSKLLKQLKQNERGEINDYIKIEPLLFKALKEFRGYYSHIFHETGPLNFTNHYPEDWILSGDKLSQEQWNLVKKWFNDKFNEAKSSKINTLEVKLSQPDLEAEQRKIAEEILQELKELPFTNNKGYLSQDALLFIACMFLRDGDAEYITQKWRHTKKEEGAKKTLENFYTFYSIKASKSIWNFSGSLFKFRQILGMLTAVPYTTNEHLNFLYKTIQNENNYTIQGIEELEYENNQQKKQIEGDRRLNKFKVQQNLAIVESKFKKGKEELFSFYINQRKNNDHIKWYAQFLLETGCFAGFKISVYKTPEYRLAFLDNLGITEDIQDFKNRIKHTGYKEEKQRLTAIYREAKKNFYFIEGSTKEGNICIKNKNIFLRFQPNGYDKEVQITVSYNILLKWVYMVLFLKNNEAEKYIKQYVNEYVGTLLAKDKKIEKSNRFPRSLYKHYSLEEIAEKKKQLDIKTEIMKKVSVKLDGLKSFAKQNEAEKRPWQFASKKKIDIIFDYNHLVYLLDALKNNKTDDDIRHESLNNYDYLAAFEFIRYFKREKANPDFATLFNRDYFKAIHQHIKTSERLEELYNKVIVDYILLLEKHIHNNAEAILAKIFNVGRFSSTDELNNRREAFVYNIALPIDVLNISKIVNYQKPAEGKSYTDFGLIRNSLKEQIPYSNIDYLMKQVMPIALKESSRNKIGMFALDLINQLKTEEYILALMAQYYWKDALGTDLEIKAANIELNNEEHIAQPIGVVNPFKNLYKKDFKLKIKSKETNKVYDITIQPSKFDDEYQYYEEAYIVKFLDNYGNKLEERSFEKINQALKAKLANTLEDIFLILLVEKNIITESKEEIKNYYNNSTDDALYIPFNRLKKNRNAPQNHYDFYVTKKLLAELNKFYKVEEKQLIQFRNDAFHRQIQSKSYYDTIRKALFEYIIAKKLLES